LADNRVAGHAGRRTERHLHVVYHPHLAVGCLQNPAELDFRSSLL
jgi:hypothetical protein